MINDAKEISVNGTVSNKFSLFSSTKFNTYYQHSKQQESLSKINGLINCSDARLISILRCLYILEMMVQAQLFNYTGDNNIFPDTKSGFPAGYASITVVADDKYRILYGYRQQ